MKLTVKSNVNPLRYRKLLNNKRLWLFGATTWHKLYNPFTPMETGQLMSNVRIEPKRVIHLVPYAKRLYYGEQFNFRTDKHPKATSKWDKAAKSTQFSKLVRAMDDYINKKDLLNG